MPNLSPALRAEYQSLRARLLALADETKDVRTAADATCAAEIIEEIIDTDGDWLQVHSYIYGAWQALAFLEGEAPESEARDD